MSKMAQVWSQTTKELLDITQSPLKETASWLGQKGVTTQTAQKNPELLKLFSTQVNSLF